MNKTITLAGSLALVLNLPLAQADDIYSMEDDSEITEAAPVEELGGLGVGALAGAAVGGPIGAIVGGLGGGLLVQGASLEDENTQLRTQLSETEGELAKLRVAHRQLTKARLQQVRLSQQQLAPSHERINDFGMSVQFRHDSAQLEPHFMRQLQQFVRSFAGFDALHVHLSGHADRNGSESYNDTLAKRRLGAVSDALRKAGWPAQRIHRYVHGERAPLGKAQDKAGYVFDRRVVIRLGRAGEGV
ncbi:MAG: OmpA family protein [Granulosicoccaceae bacterium]|jgi:sortase system peptidoglycan-associated protein